MRLDKLVKKIFAGRLLPKKVLFRVDAGRVRGLSFGHLMRCLTLAKELKRAAGSKIIFLMRDYREGVRYTRSSGFIVKTLDAAMPKKEQDLRVIEVLSDFKPDSLVADLPFDDPEAYLKYAGEKKIFTVALDDTSKRKFYGADVIINSGILAGRSAYGTCPQRTRFLLGLDYFIMNDSPSKKGRASEAEGVNVLITFGGSDVTGLTMKAVKALACYSWEHVRFIVVLGMGFKGRQAVIKAAREFKGRMKVVSNPKSMRPYFLRSSLVICAGGLTLYELNALGIPCIAIASTSHEARVIARFVEKGIIVSGLKRWNEKIFIKALKQRVDSLTGKL